MTASERTACDRLVARLVSYGEPRGFCGRWRVGLMLLQKTYGGYRRGEETRDLPVDGIRRELVEHGQQGQFYGHLSFHIGAHLLGWPGRLGSWFMNQVDEKQAATGRMESTVEVRDNVAAWACAEVLIDRSRRRMTRREAAKCLRGILAE